MAKRRLKPYLLTFCIASRFLIAVITRAYARFKIFSRFIQSRSDEISCVKTCAGDGWIRNKLLRASWNFKILLIITLFFYIEKFSKRIIIYPIVNNYRSIQILLENCIRTAQSIISKWILNNYSRFSLLGKSTVCRLFKTTFYSKRMNEKWNEGINNWGINDQYRHSSILRID